ncbi:acetylxylan esteras-like protein 1 precursor [Delitschia confertaspora ATCC 74209]|uniref:Carboxylic ester hydrolase n=1 Tax=Delitschia confertaspora ATCC 74209 TaxID=1513339 RepID=A0A9P4JRP2_9PLEO|nr:acetylxylan esteras-like protein 1 precursor [Delitschia confertaspora ATCC 74209]
MWSLTTLSTLLLSLPLTTLAALSSNLTHISKFGPNPRNVSMYIYVPKSLPKDPPILVVPHWCHGTALDAFNGRPYAALGDQYGFISIYPDSPNTADQCWDVSSPQSLSHEGGGDALGIVSMVRWTLEKYSGDRDRVFVTGTSSGAMMTQVLLGSYPDVFAAGSAFAGVPFGCYAADGYGVWSDACATGKITHSGKEWADLLHRAYPSYTGWRPKLQVWHGTADQVLNFTNFGEEIKQWTSVLGLDERKREVSKDMPQNGWTRYRYGGGRFEAFEAEGATHDIPNQADVVMEFFDLKCRSGERCFGRPKERFRGGW